MGVVTKPAASATYSDRHQIDVFKYSSAAAELNHGRKWFVQSVCVCVCHVARNVCHGLVVHTISTFLGGVSSSRETTATVHADRLRTASKLRAVYIDGEFNLHISYPIINDLGLGYSG